MASSVTSMASRLRSRLHEMFQKVASNSPQVADFLCPITGQIMEDPVTAEDKFNYERKAIEDWFQAHNTSPQTNKPMGKKIVPNRNLKKAIDKFAAHQLENDVQPATSPTITWNPHGLQQAGQKRSVDMNAALGSQSEVHEHEAAVEAAQPEPPAKRPRTDHTSRTNMSQAMSKAFKELDPLRELLQEVLDGWTPPKIIVVGDESAGKSTILEQLAGLPVFPRKRRFCTRLAIHLRLRRAQQSEASMCVYDVSTPGQEKLEGERQRMPQENGWLWVQDQMLKVVKDLSSASGTGVVKEKIIVLEVSRPDVPSIDLIDLPGLTTVPADKAKEVQQVLERQLAEDQRSGGHGMYLAVVPASGDVKPNTSTAMRFIQDHDLQSKTFGVFSKCDQAADPDILRSLMTGEETSDGDSPEMIGAVALAKGWVATMLKPPQGQEFQVHNFERILIQQAEDAAFFEKDEILQQLNASGLAGVESLVKRLEKEYHDYLNTTWKQGAMKKVLEKLDEKEFELKMLGVISEENEKDRLAKQEVERRLGPDSSVKDLYKSFLKSTVRDSLCSKMRSALAHLQTASWEGFDLDEELNKVAIAAKQILKEVLEQVQPYWELRLSEILTAESKMEKESGSADAVNIITPCTTGIRLRLFGKGQPKWKVRREIKQQPFIQLSQYKQFTDEILGKCSRLYEEAVNVLHEEAEEVVQRLIHLDSPWLQLRPDLVMQQASMDSTQVKIKFDIEGFLSALVSVFQRRIPSPKVLQNVHEGITVGTEKEAAFNKYKILKEEITKIEAAKDGICRALAITEAEIDEIQRGLDTEQ